MQSQTQQPSRAPQCAHVSAIAKSLRTSQMVERQKGKRRSPMRRLYGVPSSLVRIEEVL